jgi:hypothetical protein
MSNTAGSNISNQYAFAKNNSSKYFARQNKAYTTPDEAMKDVNSGREGYVVFLTTTDGSDLPIDFEKEYFKTIEDAKSYLQTMKDTDNKFNGCVVLANKEKETEEKLNNLINSGQADSEEEHPYPKEDQDREGAYWAESKMKETTSNAAVIVAFISGKSKPHSVNLKIETVSYNPSQGGRVLINYKTPLAFITDDGKAYLNYEKYSITTSKIQGWLHYKMSEVFDVIECDEGEIKEIIFGKTSLNIKPKPNKLKTKSYHKLPSNPNYMGTKSAYQPVQHLPPIPQEEIDPFKGEDMFTESSINQEDDIFIELDNLKDPNQAMEYLINKYGYDESEADAIVSAHQRIHKGDI